MFLPWFIDLVFCYLERFVLMTALSYVQGPFLWTSLVPGKVWK